MVRSFLCGLGALALLGLIAADASGQLRNVYGHRGSVRTGSSVRYANSMGGQSVSGTRGFSQRSLGQANPRWVPVAERKWEQGGLAGSVRNAGAASERAAEKPEPEVVQRRLGETASSDEVGHTKITHKGKRYFYRNGEFHDASFGYGKVTYRRVDPPIGATVETLPESREEVEVDGQTYYLCGETAFQRATRRGKEVWVVVEKPYMASRGT